MATATQRLVTEASLIPLAGDTGERKITTLATGLAAGDVFLSRNGPWVTLDLENVVPTTAGNWTIVTLPSGFRPPRSHQETAQPRAGAVVDANMYADGRLMIWNASATTAYRSTYRFRTNEAWPATLPGTA